MEQGKADRIMLPVILPPHPHPPKAGSFVSVLEDKAWAYCKYLICLAVEETGEIKV